MKPKKAPTPAMRSCSRQMEKLLRQAGIRLTMGGEPTFVPLQPDGDEWNTAALGPTKLGFARKLAGELIKRHYPGSLVTQAYGKQYPGEPLPRWSLIIHTGTEKPLWKRTDRLLLGDSRNIHSLESVSHIADLLAKELGLSAKLLAAKEWGDESPKGWVLPLNHEGSRWISDHWGMTSKDVVRLVPGDSSIGLRLPLNSLPEGALRRALTIEWKDGGLEIFFPPLDIKGYMKLLRIIEKIAQKEDLYDLILAGYPPQHSGQVEQFILASDPGVIEVNLPPCKDWEEYDKLLHRLYDAADSTGLRACKLNYNGHIQGTGGAAHICFGGPVKEESPLLKIPHLLPGIVRYFQNHPALSYAFSGQFLGPSSQAPRIDETTFEAMEELEVAMPGAGKVADSAYLFGMLFRDLLMDRTGNTHRAEVSIDKMWNTFAPNGTMGIIEFRAVESTPEYADLSAIALLFRAIVARLALKPYTAPFIRWGLRLHDHYFLPNLIEEDMELILRDLHRHGIPFKKEWLDPFFQFRFPEFGRLEIPGGELVCRHALEAWPLLGEQPSGSFTSRFIDSCNERIEILLDKPTLASRGFLLVNGLPVELAKGRKSPLAGLRFRAFYRVPALHPHLGSQSPLLIEWVDKKTCRVLSAVEWHSWQPNGQPYPNRPSSMEEAAVRMKDRWIPRPDLAGRRRKPPKPLGGIPGHLTTDLRKLVV